jgi:hypothetical protein
LGVKVGAEERVETTVGVELGSWDGAELGRGVGSGCGFKVG